MASVLRRNQEDIASLPRLLGFSLFHFAYWSMDDALLEPIRGSFSNLCHAFLSPQGDTQSVPPWGKEGLRPASPHTPLRPDPFGIFFRRGGSSAPSP
jgi:hypothetical protein